MTQYSYISHDKCIKEIGAANLQQRRRLCTAREFRELIRDRGLIQRNSSNRGIPQGSPISAILSNLYMLSADEIIAVFCAENDCFYRRYSDDIILVAPPDKVEIARALIEYQLDRLGLHPNPRKTEVYSFERKDNELKISGNKPLQYLGFTFDGSRVQIRPSTLARYHRKLRRYVDAAERKAAKNPNTSKVYRRKAFRDFSMRGRRNVISYARRADATFENSVISRQIAGHWPTVNRLLNEADTRIESKNRN